MLYVMNVILSYFHNLDLKPKRNPIKKEIRNAHSFAIEIPRNSNISS